MVLAQDQAQASESAAIIAEQQYQKDLAKYNQDLEKYNKEKAIYDAEVKKIADTKAVEEKKQAEEKAAAEKKDSVYSSVPSGAGWEDYIKDKENVYRGGGEGRRPGNRESSRRTAIDAHFEAGTLPPTNRGGQRGSNDTTNYTYTQMQQEYTAKVKAEQAQANIQVAREQYGFEMTPVPPNAGKDVFNKINNPTLYGGSRDSGGHIMPNVVLGFANKDLRAGNISINTYQETIGQVNEQKKQQEAAASAARSRAAQVESRNQLSADSKHWQSVVNDPNTSGSNQATINSLGLSHDVAQLDALGISSIYNETDLTKAGSLPSEATVTINKPAMPGIPVRTNTSGNKGVNESNQIQQQYVKDLREGKIGIAQALLQPQTPQSYPTKNTINTKQFLTERGYDISKPETIPDSIFMNPQKYDDARKQAKTSSQKDTTMGDLRKLIPASPQVSDAVVQQRRKAMENIAASKGGSYIGYGVDGTPIQGAPAPNVIDNTKTQWAVDIGRTKNVTLPRIDGTTYTAKVPDPLLFDTQEQAREYVHHQKTSLGFYHVLEEPTAGGKFMEDAYKYLDESQIGLVKDRNKGGIAGNAYYLVEGAVDVVKTGLSMAIQLDNLASQTIAPYVSKVTGLNPQNQFPSRPLIQSTESGDQTVFPYNFEENRFKSGQEVLSSSVEYMKKYGVSAWWASVGVAYYPGTALAKSTLPIAKVAVKVPGLVKTPINTLVPGEVTKMAYRLQVPTSIRTLAKTVPIRIVKPGIIVQVGDEFIPTVTHTSVRFGYDFASIPLGGKYKGGTFYKGMADDLEQSGLKKQVGADGSDSFNTHQVSHYSETELKELTPLVKQAATEGARVGDDWVTLARERIDALNIVKQQHKIFVDTKTGLKRKFIEYKKSIDEGVKTGDTMKKVVKGEIAVQKTLWKMMNKFKVKTAKEKFKRQVKRDGIIPEVNAQPVPTLKTISSFKGKLIGTSSQPVTTLKIQRKFKDSTSNQAVTTLNTKSFLHTKLIGTSSRPIIPLKIKSSYKGKMTGSSSQPVPTLRVQRKFKDSTSNQAVTTLNTPSLHKGKFKSTNYNPVWNSHVVDMGKKRYFVPPVIKKFKELPVSVKENVPGIFTSKYLGDTKIAQNEFGMLRSIHPGIIDKESWLKFSQVQKDGLIGSMKGSGVYNLIKDGIRLAQHDIDAMKLVQTDEAAKIMMSAKSRQGSIWVETSSGVGIGKKIPDDIIEQRNIEMMQGIETQSGVNVYFHGTTEDVAKNILKSGLNPKKSGIQTQQHLESIGRSEAYSQSRAGQISPPGTMFLASNYKMAQRFADDAAKATGKKGVVLRFELKDKAKIKQLDKIDPKKTELAEDIATAKKQKMDGILKPMGSSETNSELILFNRKIIDNTKTIVVKEKLSKIESLRKADPKLSEEAVIQLEKDPMGMTQAIKSGDNFKPITEGEDVTEVFNLVSKQEELVAATGKNTDAFYGKVRDTGSPIKIKIDGTKKTITTQNFGQQHLDKTGSISGIVSARTFENAQVAYDAAKMFPGETTVRYGHAIPFRHSKDVVDQWFFSSRYAAKQAWATGNKKLAREIGETMRQRHALEKSKGLDWYKAIKERKAESEIEFKFDKTPENINKKDIGGGISTIQSVKSSPMNVKYKESEIDSEIRDWSRQLDQREVVVKPRSATTRTISSPRTFSKSTFSSSSFTSSVKSSLSSSSPSKSSSSSFTSSVKSSLSSSSPSKSSSSSFTSSVKSSLSSSSPSKSSSKSPSKSSPFKSPSSPKSPFKSSPTRKSRTIVVGGMGDSDREIVKEKKTKRKDFLASSRTDHIVGMFNRRAIIEGDKKSEKQLLKDKRYKEGKKKKKIKKKEKSFFQKHGIINKKFKI